MPPDPDGPGGQVQSRGNLLGPQGFHVAQAQDLAVARTQVLEGLTDLFAPLLSDQVGEWIFLGIRLGALALQSRESAGLAAFGA